MIPVSTLKIYNASAGSGKTYTLVKEYLTIILASHDYHYFRHILAITFTNKAAGEMKERILSSLEKFASNQPKDWEDPMFQDLCNDLNLKPIQLNERAKKTLSSILHHYSEFSVSTIDKFTQRLVRNFTHDLGLPSNFEVEFDEEKLLNESVGMLLAKLGENDKITQVLVQFALSKLDDEKSWNITSDLVNASKILLKEGNWDKVTQLKEHSIDDFTALRVQLNQNQKEIEQEAKKIQQDFFKYIDSLGIDVKSFSYSDLPNYFKKFSSDITAVSVGKRLQNQIDTQVLYGKATASDQKALIDSNLNTIINLFEASVDFLIQHKSQYVLNNLILRNITSLSVISEVEKELAEIKEENNILLSGEFNKIISQELKNQPAPYIYERIGEKYKHYFIDEFQDTSILQFENLYPLIHNQIAQDGNALIVGDSKQSIYRWRGGEPEQFIDLTKNGKGLPFQVEDLKTNFRSHQEIIQFNNDLYQTAAKVFKNQDYERLYFETAPQLTNAKENGYIEINLIEKGKNTKEEYEAQQFELIQAKIQELKEEKFEYQDITILVRNNNEGVKIAQYLIENEISIVSKESLLLINSVEIQITEKMLRLICTENDFQTRVQLLVQLHQNQLLQNVTELHTLIQEVIQLPLYQFFESLQPYGVDFELSKARSMSIYDLVEYIYRSLHLIRPEKNAYLQYFLDFCLAYSVRKGNFLLDFLMYWDEKKAKESIVTPDALNAVQIMTIHKSKGLQFPVVILPFADWDAFKEKNPKIWMPLDKEKFHNFENFYVDANKDLASDNGIGAELIQQNLDQAQLDSLNLLYVATTRAEERLYIASNCDCNKTTGETTTIFYYLKKLLEEKNIFQPDVLTYSFGNKIHTQKPKKEVNIQNIQFHSTDWRTILEISKTAPLYWNTDAESVVEYGNTIHQLLSYIKYKDEIEKVIDNHIDTGLVASSEREILLQLVRQIVEHPSLNQYFERNQIVYNEREIAVKGKLYRPDRINIQDKNVTIIDYKTGIKQEKYKRQLNDYAHAMQELGYTIKELILVYIHETIEVVVY